MNRRYAVAVLALGLLGAAACGGSEKAANTAAPATSGQTAGAAVAIQTFQFQPSPVEIKTGTKVTWTNRDDITHTVTAGTPENRSGRFDLPMNGKDQTVTFTFSEPGTYAYFCARHESMRGEVRVGS
jgi:plastocyanin